MKPSLSTRELQLLQSVIYQGYDKRRIIAEFCISEHTLKSHLCRIYAKLDVPNLTDAVVKAIRQGIVQLGTNRLEGWEE